MSLIGDRFLLDEQGRAVDLATGEQVVLRQCTAGGPSEQARWAERCAWLASIVHPALAPLLDYGVFGEATRFEAWCVSLMWRGSAQAAQAVVARASAFLAANGRQGCEPADAQVGVCRGRTVVVPEWSAAEHLLDGAAETRRPPSADDVGILRGPDRRLGPVFEMLGASDEQRLAALSVWCPEGGGARSAVLAIARAARLAGYVPVDARLVRASLLERLAGRTLLVIGTADADAAWSALLAARLFIRKAHTLVCVGATHVRRVHVVPLERPSEANLVASVIPAESAARQSRRVRTAARRARGLVERFEQLLLNQNKEMHAVAESTRSGGAVRGVARGALVHPRAAEHLGVDPADDVEGRHLSVVQDRGWPAPGELMRLRRQFASAAASIESGRFAPGVRALRQVMHAFARRGEWGAATESAVLLGHTLRRRAQVPEAAQVAAVARGWATAANDVRLLQEVGWLTATVLADSGRFADAELLLDGVLASMVSTGSPLVFDASLSLVRCLFWQGRTPDAWHRLALVRPEDGSAAAVRWLAARSRLALGRGRPADAVADAARAREVAQALDRPALLALAFEACATAQMAVGDAAQATATAESGIGCARRAHDTRRLLRLRLVRAEAALRTGSRQPAAMVLRRSGEAAMKAWPATVAARVDVLRGVMQGGAPADVVERVAEVRSMPALRGLAAASPSDSAHVAPAADDIADLLRCCHVAEEDVAVLAAVCARLRQRLRSTSVSFFGERGRDLVCISSDGGRDDGAFARRVWDAGQLVLPVRSAERGESGVPVRYAGKTVGVLVARWTAGSHWNVADVSVLLTTGAAAAGPALAGALAARRSEPDARMPELVGVGPGMEAVRSAIERAASAPFSVLIEGESGSGKELVARSLHRLGGRRDRPFCAVNCAALPDELVESELFGHARGAFTGASAERRGVFEEAHTGTLFLDEVGELSARAQAKLLRTIQEGEIRRVGENVSRRVDVRLVAATHRCLRDEVAAGRFRLDLLYRLDVIRIPVPPLRDRRDDIALLADHLWREAAARVGSRATLAASTLTALERYDWPGNIRELQNILASLAVRCAKRGVIGPEALPPHVTEVSAEGERQLEPARRAFERTFVRAALARAGGRRTRAADELGVSRQGLAKLVARLGLDEAVR